MFPFFDHGPCGVLATWPGIEPTPSALEDEVLTTEEPGKCPNNCLLKIPDEFYFF